MESTRLDRLTKSLVSGQSRRTMLKGLMGGGAAAAISSSNETVAQDASPEPEATPEPSNLNWLLVAHANQVVTSLSCSSPTRTDSRQSTRASARSTVPLKSYASAPVMRTGTISPGGTSSSINTKPSTSGASR